MSEPARFLEGERWWKIPPEKLESYERDQSAYEAQFDFSNLSQIIGVGVAASSDGKTIGVEIRLRNGTCFRGAMSPNEMDLIYLLVGKVAQCWERCEVRAGLVEGKPN